MGDEDLNRKEHLGVPNWFGPSAKWIRPHGMPEMSETIESMIIVILQSSLLMELRECASFSNTTLSVAAK
jgi:hypothetical protein